VAAVAAQAEAGAPQEEVVQAAETAAAVVAEAEAVAEAAAATAKMLSS
jgi:hypothetical protein